MFYYMYNTMISERCQTTYAIIPAMKLKNRAAALFGIGIVLFMGYILYLSLKPPIDVVIQAGHEGRVRGNTGSETATLREELWNIQVANTAAKQLEAWGIEVKRVPADTSLIRAKVAVAIHFDGAKVPCLSGASVGYPDNNTSYTFAQHWKALYKPYFPFKWHEDNFTKNLKEYYGYSWIKANTFVVLELGELTCSRQTAWLQPRLEALGKLVAYAIAVELGKEVPKPKITL